MASEETLTLRHAGKRKHCILSFWTLKPRVTWPSWELGYSLRVFIGSNPRNWVLEATGINQVFLKSSKAIRPKEFSVGFSCCQWNYYLLYHKKKCILHMLLKSSYVMFMTEHNIQMLKCRFQSWLWYKGSSPNHTLSLGMELRYL